MYPKLYDSSNTLLAVLDNIIDDSATIKRVVNGEFTFSFNALEKELKSEYFDPDNYLVVDEQTFDIKYIEQEHEDDITYSIQCEHVNYRMEDGDINLYDTYTGAGTPTQILMDLLSGTQFNVGVVDFSEPVVFQVKTQMTRKSLITQFVNAIGGEIEYTNLGFTINILNTIGKDNGFQVRFGKNLKGIKKIIDKRGELKTSYEVDVVVLKNSTEYIKNDLGALEVIGVGDSVRVIDNVIGLDIKNRIFSIEYNPIFAINTKLEIANTIEVISDTIQKIEKTSIHNNTVYNGCSISEAEGFVAKRSDDKAKTMMNATDGFRIFSDTGHGLLMTFYVDTDGRLKAKEIDIDGDSTFRGEVDITAGGTQVKLSPKDATPIQLVHDSVVIFYIDQNGRIKAKNLDIDESGTFGGTLSSAKFYRKQMFGSFEFDMVSIDDKGFFVFATDDMPFFVSAYSNTFGIQVKDHEIKIGGDDGIRAWQDGFTLATSYTLGGNPIMTSEELSGLETSLKSWAESKFQSKS